jgi:hypothetical protein
MKTKDENKPPSVAGFCQVIAWLSILAGGIIIAGVIITPAGPGMLSPILTSAALIFSSLIWFAGARVIILLAQIAHNTAPK